MRDAILVAEPAGVAAGSLQFSLAGVPGGALRRADRTGRIPKIHHVCRGVVLLLRARKRPAALSHLPAQPEMAIFESRAAPAPGRFRKPLLGPRGKRRVRTD